MNPLLVLLLTTIPSAPPAQSSGPEGVRLIRAEPTSESLEFGEPAVLRVELRVGPGVVLFLPDTLQTAAEMESAGLGRWTTEARPADSLEVIAEYPIIGYRRGIQELPKLELMLANRAGGSGPARVLARAELPANGADELETRVMPLGSTTISAYTAVQDSTGGVTLAPRPPADVAGGEWSLWLVLALGLASAAGAGGIGVLAPRWWAQQGAGWLARLRGNSPKQQALKELERIRSLGWHVDGRLEDFYASSTAVVRRYAERLDPEWTPAFTTSELLEGLEARWKAPALDRLAGALSNAERVKFGTFRPEPATAEGDWQAIRDWVRSLPEP